MRADGTEFPAEVAVTRIPARGSPIFTGFIRDVTERKRAEAFEAGQKHVLELLAPDE